MGGLQATVDVPVPTAPLVALLNVAIRLFWGSFPRLFLTHFGDRFSVGFPPSLDQFAEERKKGSSSNTESDARSERKSRRGLDG